MATNELTHTDPERIKQLRQAAGLSQEGLAERLTVARMTLGKLESRPCDRVDHFVLRKLAGHFGVSIDSLLRKGA